MKARFVFTMLLVAAMMAFTSCQDSTPKNEQKSEQKNDTLKESKQETTVQYTCPMHPEVVQAEPGKCPKCGMELEVKK